MRRKRVVLPIVCSLIFRGKASKSHAKRMKTILVFKNHHKITRGTLLFSKKTLFSEFFGSPWIPRGLLGRPGKFPKSVIFLIHGQLRLKTTVDGLREASGRPPRCLQAPPGYDFALIFGSILHIKTKRKYTKNVEKNSKNIERQQHLHLNNQVIQVLRNIIGVAKTVASSSSIHNTYSTLQQYLGWGLGRRTKSQ